MLAVALVVLGPKRLPEAGRSLDRGLRELKGSLSGDSSNASDELEAGQAKSDA